MKVAFLWRLAVRQLHGAGRAIGRFLGPFPPAGPDARFTPDFRVHASYGRFVFSMHALAPRQEPLCQSDVHDALNGSGSAQANWPARHPAEMALIAGASRRTRRHCASAEQSKPKRRVRLSLDRPDAGQADRPPR